MVHEGKKHADAMPSLRNGLGRIGSLTCQWGATSSLPKYQYFRVLPPSTQAPEHNLIQTPRSTTYLVPRPPQTRRSTGSAAITLLGSSSQHYHRHRRLSCPCGVAGHNVAQHPPSPPHSCSGFTSPSFLIYHTPNIITGLGHHDYRDGISWALMGEWSGGLYHLTNFHTACHCLLALVAPSGHKVGQTERGAEETISPRARSASASKIQASSAYRCGMHQPAASIDVRHSLTG